MEQIFIRDYPEGIPFMKIAFILYDGVTTLDFAGMYDPVTRLKTMGFLPDLAYDVCALTERVRAFEGITLVPDRYGCDLAGYDYVLVPGGNSIKELLKDRTFPGWIARVPDKTVIAAVCGGALIVGAAGKLRDRRATTHPALLDFLKHFAKEVSADRIVEDRNVITAGGVTASIDLGLYLTEKIAGAGVREKIQAQMDYHAYITR